MSTAWGLIGIDSEFLYTHDSPPHDGDGSSSEDTIYKPNDHASIRTIPAYKRLRLRFELELDPRLDGPGAGSDITTTSH